MVEGRLRRAWAWLRRGVRCVVGSSWRLALLRAVLALALAGVGALAFVAAGLMPIAASDGHWPVTRVFLHWVMLRSVDTATAGVEAPPLDDPALVLRGAGHYATGCEPCHGAPGRPRSPLVQRMLPVPPGLSSGSALSDAELFWVIRHGIKYTAMPAWVAQQREDEVWAMVAFVRALPQMDAARYRALAHGERAGLQDPGAGLSQLAATATPALDGCVRCHGEDGGGRGGAFPVIAGQDAAYLRAALDAYARGLRRSGMMQPAAAGLSAAQIDRIARHFAALPAPRAPATPARPHDPTIAAAIARGRALAHDGDPARRVPSCVECHGPGAAPRNPMYPALAGQHADYLALQLRLFRQGARGGTGYATVMRTVAARLDEGDIRDLAAYYASARQEGMVRKEEAMVRKE